MKMRAPAVLLAGMLILSGCAEPEVVPSEPKRAEDQITAAELESFLSVVTSLADSRLPPIPPVLLAAPQWSRQRTLPVSELVKEEQKQLKERMTIEWLADHCPQSRFLKRALRREKMSLEQFVGLYLALGLSLSRDHVPADRDLDQIVARGQQSVSELSRDQRTFSSLADDAAYYLEQQAGWLPVVDRSSRLKLVHAENLALVRRNRERLEAVLPAEFARDPFLEFHELLDDRGVPFTEPAGQPSDERILWSRAQALTGSSAAP